MYGLTVHVKEALPFAWDLSLEKSADSYCFRLTLLHSVSYFFFLYRSSSSLCMVFYSISSNIDVFVFGDFNVHHKDCLTYSSGTVRPDNLCYNFSISNDLTQMVKGCVCYILLVCFLSLSKSTCQTRKKIFHFTSKALFIL